MTTARPSLFQRLPELYRQRDAEQTPPGQLEAFLGALDAVLAAQRNDTERLYHNLFIETCDDWVVPYIADLLGTSHLSGDPWTLRADVARTVRLRRRKGTLGAIESLARALTGWACHAVEMRERLAWNQNLNHPRPDAGGAPPHTAAGAGGTAVRGGSANLRHPGLATLSGGAFEPFARTADVKPPGTGHNLPNLALFLWRLAAYTVPLSRPLAAAPVQTLTTAAAGDAAFAVRMHAHPLGQTMVLFNTWRYAADAQRPELSTLDAVPGPMPAARLTSGSPAGNPGAYLQVLNYESQAPESGGELGLTLHLPAGGAVDGIAWRWRGANLCAWEAGLNPPLRQDEIVVDPKQGRILFGFDNAAAADEALAGLFVSASYGFSGAVGAHPVARTNAGSQWQVVPRRVNGHTAADPANVLRDALADLADAEGPVIVEIEDSLTHDLDLATVPGSVDEAGLTTLLLAGSLWIRAASGQRPVIRLRRPLAFRPADVSDSATLATLQVRLEGLYVTQAAGFAGEALIERAALNRLVIEGCTLDPGGQLAPAGDGSRLPFIDALKLANDYGFAQEVAEENAEEGELRAFDQMPALVLRRSIAGRMRVDSDYELACEDSIVDAGSGMAEGAPRLAIGAAGDDPEGDWGPRFSFSGLTCFGRVRVWSGTGSGGLFVHRFEAHDNQQGCLRESWLRGAGDRLPPHRGCVFAPARLAFVAETFGQPGYAQLRRDCHPNVLEDGPGADEMGAFGWLRNTHKWKNFAIRQREFMPAQARPVTVPIT